MKTASPTPNPIITSGIIVTAGMKVFYPQGSVEEELQFTPRTPMTYEYNNGVIVWTNADGVTYVAVVTKELWDAIKSAEFTRQGQYVPFSNCDYPVDHKAEWDAMWEKRREEIA